MAKKKETPKKKKDKVDILKLLSSARWKKIYKMAANPAQHSVALYNACLEIVELCPKIFFVSQIFSILGLTKHAFYQYIYTDKRIDAINILVRRNRSLESISAMKKLEESTSPTAIIARIKLTSPESHLILREKDDGDKEEVKSLTREEKEAAIKKMNESLKIKDEEESEEESEDDS